MPNLGPIFRTFFPRNFLEKLFFKTFSAENSIFSQHFEGKFSAKFPGKMYKKSAPLAISSLVCSENKNIFFDFEERCSLPQR
jgi:hypothetical protein